MAGSAQLILPSQALGQLPSQLRGDLLDSFAKIVGNYSEGRWEPAELNGAKLCEAAFSICEGLVTGTMPQRAQKPKDIVAASKALEKHGGGSRSARIQIPRMVVALYEIRNNRNVGHLGGDVDPNHMDALCVLQMSKWIVADLVRILHGMSVDAAANLVDALVEREVPLVWKVGGKRRVLDPALGPSDKTLLILHGCAGAATEADLIDWVEHTGRASWYRRDVLAKQHALKNIEYNREAKTAVLSPKGVQYVEDNIIAPRLATAA